jgi:hypothetical protein
MGFHLPGKCGLTIPGDSDIAPGFEEPRSLGRFSFLENRIQ